MEEFAHGQEKVVSGYIKSRMRSLGDFAAYNLWQLVWQIKDGILGTDGGADIYDSKRIHLYIFHPEKRNYWVDTMVFIR